MNTNEIITSYSSAEYTYKTNNKPVKTAPCDQVSKTPEKESDQKKDTGVVYDSANIKNMSETDRKALVEKLKADADARVSQLKSLVEKMFLKQSEKSQNCTDIWKFLASGEYTVDPKTAAEAKEAISEDGYWGVEQTSSRIFDMAVALSGGDADKMDDMLEAFKKGFKQATDTWGKELPDISQRTYGAVLEKFENYKNEQASAADTVNTAADPTYTA